MVRPAIGAGFVGFDHKKLCMVAVVGLALHVRSKKWHLFWGRGVGWKLRGRELERTSAAKAGVVAGGLQYG